MKFLTTLLAFCLIQVAFCQDVNIPEPEWEGNVVYVNDSLKEGVVLNMQKAYTKTKAGASLYVVGVGKVKSKSYVNGSTSKLHINKKKNIQFIIKCSSNNTDPKSFINIFPLVSNSDTRFIETSSLGTFSGSESMNIDYVPFKGEKYGEFSYLLTISDIENGEYAITLPQTRMNFNLFSIGAPRKQTNEEIIRNDVKKGDVVWFQNNGEWIEAKAFYHDYYGLKITYLKKGKEKKKVIPYNLISLEKR